MSRPSVCIEDVRGALQLIALDRRSARPERRSLAYAPSVTGLALSRSRCTGDLREVARDRGTRMRVVLGDHVIRLAVGRIDPYARCIDIAERGLECGLRRSARAHADQGLLRRGAVSTRTSG